MSPIGQPSFEAVTYDAELASLRLTYPTWMVDDVDVQSAHVMHELADWVEYRGGIIVAGTLTCEVVEREVLRWERRSIGFGAFTYEYWVPKVEVWLDFIGRAKAFRNVHPTDRKAVSDFALHRRETTVHVARALYLEAEWG